MMKLFSSLYIASSKASCRSLAAKHPYEPRFFSAQPSAIPQDFSQTHATDVEEKSTTRIRIMSIQHVKPNKPTPDNLRSYKLSAIDQINVPAYVPLVFFYANNAKGKTDINIDNMVVERSKKLRDSLSETLTRFYPFAGKYIDDNHIDCNDEGVYYVETRVDTNLSSFITKPDYKQLQGLLPMPQNLNEPTRGGHYLSLIQVNFFSCGGVGICMSNSHKLIDGSTNMTFLNAWASASKGDDEQKIIYPNHVASSIFVAKTKPPTYSYLPLSFLAIWPLILRRGKSSTKRFRFDAYTLQALKAKAAGSSVSSSRVVSVISLIWKCATNASRKLHGEKRPSVLRTAVNLRSRLAPPLPRNAIGNVIWNAVARCEADERLELGSMIGRIKDGIAKVDTGFVERFKGENGSDNVIDEMQKLAAQFLIYGADCYSSSSMCNSGLYDADFGWGKPVWTCFGHLSDDNPLYNNVILLMDTSSGDGIEAWVTLSQQEMDLVERDPDLLLYASVDPSPLQG